MFARSGPEELTPNVLSLCIQPDEGIHQRFEAKVPGTEAEMRSVEMEFHYRDTFPDRAIPDAYERLVLDALQGDPSLFTRSDRAEISWGLIDPIIAGIQQAGGPPLHLYEPGSWGPTEADELLARDGSSWLLGCGGHSNGSPP